MPTHESYGMVEIVTPPRVQGPPPHFHKDESEFFFIVKGTLDVMRDGEWSRVTAGSFVELPAKTVERIECDARYSNYRRFETSGRLVPP